MRSISLGDMRGSVLFVFFISRNSYANKKQGNPAYLVGARLHLLIARFEDVEDCQSFSRDFLVGNHGVFFSIGICENFGRLPPR